VKIISKAVLICKNTITEGPDTIKEFLETKKISYKIVELSMGEKIPDTKDFDVLIMLGGPMSVNEDDLYSYIKDEEALVRKFIKEDKKILGICLGAQIIAKALGASVYKGKQKETGWFDIELTNSGIKNSALNKLLTNNSKNCKVFQLHGETFDIPDGAAKLAGSKLFQNQAFKYNKAYALQFHIEVYKDTVFEWLKDEDIDLDKVKAETEQFYEDYRKKAFDFYKEFLLKHNDKFLLKEYEENLSSKIKKALKLCYTAADKISLPIYLIGGTVRDIIIGQKNFDIDIAVEKNAIEFSKFLRKEYPGICSIKEIHEDFKTTKVIFNINNENVEIDIASTRQEEYKYPASLPTVEKIGCAIYEDITRRDFTINSMALTLNQANFCKLVDPLNGYEDLLNKKIRILHPLSFIDDPTRIIRALKFSVRFNMELENSTKKLQTACIKSGLFNNIANERIKSEIKQTFNLNQARCLEKFLNEKIYCLLDKDISVFQDKIIILSSKCENLINKYKKFISKDLIWLIYLGILTINLSMDKIDEICQKLYLSGLESEILYSAKNISEKMNLIKSAKTRFEIYEQLEGYFTESILINLITTEDNEIAQNVDLYIKKLQNIKIYTTGKTLINLGLTPGPIFGKILRELLKAKINQEIFTEEDEIKYIEKI